MEHNKSEILSSISTLDAGEITTVSFQVPSTQTVPLIIMPLTITSDVIRAFFGILAIIGNSLMMTAFAKFQDLRTKSNMLLINLAVVDCLSGFSNLIHPIVKYLATNTTPAVKMMHMLNRVSALGEVLALLVIAGERYIHIVYALKYMTIVTVPRICKVLVLFWVCLIGLVIPGVMKIDSYYDHRSLELFEDTFNQTFMGACMQLLVLLTIYGLIYRKAYTGNKIHVQSAQNGAHASTNPTTCYKIFKSACIVLGAYLASVVPFLICGILCLAGVIEPMTYVLYCLDISSAFYYIQTWVNPIIYCGRDKSMKKAVCKLLNITQNSVETVPAINLQHLNLAA